MFCAILGRVAGDAVLATRAHGGIGLGNLVIGALSDAMKLCFGDEWLRYAILSGTVFYLCAALLFLLAASRLEKDWEK